MRNDAFSERGEWDDAEGVPGGAERMWRMVVAQALRDGTLGLSGFRGGQRRNIKPNPNDIVSYWQAIEWFNGGSTFNTICCLAGYDPGYVKRKSPVMTGRYAERVKELLSLG